ncbi:hypothetical protein ACFQX6_65025 [Streptosporangium lutulentum]
MISDSAFLVEAVRPVVIGEAGSDERVALSPAWRTVRRAFAAWNGVLPA